MKDYKEVWNNLSDNFTDANFYVWGIGDEAELRRNGKITAEFLRQVLDITPESRVLEIGCGIARIGKELAPFCEEWHGTDISGNMIEYATERTSGMPNVYLHELPDTTLSIFPDNYFDCVYSTIVFMHLDKLDMFRYMQEAQRVLAPGGRVYFDANNILAPDGWRDFVYLLEVFSPGLRPAHMIQFSTPQEMEKFMKEAGFEDVQVNEDNSQLVVVLGRKSGQPGFVRSKSMTLSPVTSVDRVAEGHGSGETISEHGATRGLVTPAEVLNLTAAKKSLRAEVDRLKEHVVAQEEYSRRLESTLEEKNFHIRDLESCLESYHRAMLKDRTLKRAGLAGLGAVAGILAAARLLGRRS